MTLRRAAFIDRDGVLNQDHGYVYRHEDFHWLPGAILALSRLQRAGYALVVVTNQSGIARGLYTQGDMEALHRTISQELQDQGVQLAGIYACPHHPQAVRPELRIACACRKPMPGMILQAAGELGLDLGASCLFGDKVSDIEAGRRAGVRVCWLIGEPATARECGADGASDSLAQAVASLFAADADVAG